MNSVLKKETLLKEKQYSVPTTPSCLTQEKPEFIFDLALLKINQPSTHYMHLTQSDQIISNMAENTTNSDDHKITLRPMKLSDIQDFMVWATDDRVTKFCLWDTYTSQDEALHFFNNNVFPHPWYRAICIDDRAVGSISVTPSSDNPSSKAELGYVLAFQHWGKGITTEAVKMVASTIFVDWPQLERLEAFVDVDNVGSQRVLTKACFLREGVLRKNRVIKGKSRDEVIFSLLSSDQHLPK